MSGARRLSVKDDCVIRHCAENGFLLLTADKRMKDTHAAEILATDIAIVATAGNKGDDVVRVYTRAFVDVRQKILRDFRKRERPHFAVLQKSGRLDYPLIQARTKR